MQQKGTSRTRPTHVHPAITFGAATKSSSRFGTFLLCSLVALISGGGSLALFGPSLFGPETKAAENNNANKERGIAMAQAFTLEKEMILSTSHELTFDTPAHAGQRGLRFTDGAGTRYEIRFPSNNDGSSPDAYTLIKVNRDTDEGTMWRIQWTADNALVFHHSDQYNPLRPEVDNFSAASQWKEGDVDRVSLILLHKDMRDLVEALQKVHKAQYTP